MKSETRAIKRIKFIEKSQLIHQNKFDYSNTINKEQIIISAGYNLITIWESDWKNLKKHLMEK